MTEVFKPSTAYVLLTFGGAAILTLLFAFPIGFLLAPLVFAYGFIWRHFRSYELTDDGVFIKSGMVMRSESLFLYSQIQDLEENQSFLQRIAGVYSFRIVTMSSDSALSGSVTGMGSADADKFRSELKQRLKGRKEDKIGGVVQARNSEKENDAVQAPYAINVRKGTLGAALATVGAFTVLGILFSVFFMMSKINIIGIMAFSFIFMLFLITLPVVVIVFVNLNFTSYGLGSNTLEIKYDFLHKKSTRIRYDRIQNVVIKQNLVERWLGIANVLVETGEFGIVATNEENSRRVANFVPALNFADAHALKDVLLEEIGVEKQDFVDLRAKYPLESVKPFKKTLAWAPWVALLAIVGIVFFQLQSFALGTVAVLVLAVAILGLKLVYEFLYYQSYSYSSGNQVLRIGKGALGFNEVFLPYSRVQNLFVDNDIFDRMFGLRDVHLSSIGIQSAMEAHIDGVSPENAAGLKELLQNLVKKNSSRA